jgi:sugar phosphate isomerase/epimerase
LCKNSAEQLFYINKINSPYLRATADIGNYWHPGGERPVDGVKNIAGFVAMVHVKDYVIINNKFTAVPSGDGVIDLQQCFRILKDAGYKGTLSLEYECSIGEGRHGITTSLVNMRRADAGC